MTNAPDPREATARLEADLLARLGLTAGAGSEEIDAAYDEIVQYVEKSPSALRAWAADQVRGADEAHALLRGPRADLVGAAMAALPAAGEPAQAPTPFFNAPANAALAAVVEDDALDWPDDLDTEAPVPNRLRSQRPPRRQAGSARRPAGPSQGSSSTLRRAAIVSGVLVAAVLIAIGGYNLNSLKAPAIIGTPPPSTPAVDPAQVAALTQVLAENPNDTTTMLSLAGLYYAAQDTSTARIWVQKVLAIEPNNMNATMSMGNLSSADGDFTTARTWFQKVLTLDPGNINGLLALGATDFNTGDFAPAETAWRQVLTLDPNNVDAHYNLGFMDLSKTPPDYANAKIEWQKVIDIAPNSSVAQAVAAELQSIDALASP